MIVICVGALPHAGPAQAADTQTRVRKKKPGRKRNRIRRGRRANQQRPNQRRARAPSGSTPSARPKTNKTKPSAGNSSQATDEYDRTGFEGLNLGHNLARLEDDDLSFTQVARELARGSGFFRPRAGPGGNSGFDRFGPDGNRDAAADPSRILDPSIFAPLDWTADAPDGRQGFDSLLPALPTDGPIVRAIRYRTGPSLFGLNSTRRDNALWPLQFQCTDAPAWELGTYNFVIDPTAAVRDTRYND